MLERYTAPHFVRLARTAEPLGAEAQPARALGACRAALGELDPAGLALLIDWRLSPQATAADELELAAVREAVTFAAPFARSAVLLLTAADPARLWSSARLPVFHDEEAAIAYVSGAAPSR